MSDVLTLTQKEAVRKICGYSPLKEMPRDGGTLSFQWAGTLEWRVATLTPPEARMVQEYLAQIDKIDPKAIGGTDQLRCWSRRLCGFLGILPGPMISEPNADG